MSLPNILVFQKVSKSPKMSQKQNYEQKPGFVLYTKERQLEQDQNKSKGKNNILIADPKDPLSQKKKIGNSQQNAVSKNRKEAKGSPPNLKKVLHQGKMSDSSSFCYLQEKIWKETQSSDMFIREALSPALWLYSRLRSSAPCLNGTVSYSLSSTAHCANECGKAHTSAFASFARTQLRLTKPPCPSASHRHTPLARSVPVHISANSP